MLIEKNGNIGLMGKYSTYDSALQQKRYWEKNYAYPQEVDKIVVDELVEKKKEGGKLEPTIEELKAKERKSQEDFNRLWSGFKRNVADAFSGYERPSSQETNSFIEEYNKASIYFQTILIEEKWNQETHKTR